MLDRNSWWPAAERLNLQEGQRRRITHECGPGPSLLVSRDKDEYRAWCFRCNDGDGFELEPESMADRIARAERNRQADVACSGMGGYPEPAVHDVDAWPAAARLWLYRAGLGRSEIGRLGIYYHADTDRVVLPVRGDKDAGDFWQARAYQKGRLPKYLGPTPRPPKLLPRWGVAPSPTLTEDLLSAMKIGMVGEGWCVLGTTISPYMMAELMKRGACVNVALDPDPAGRKGAAKICKQLRAYGIAVRDVVMPRDPKLMPLDYLRSVLVEGKEPSEVA